MKTNRREPGHRLETSVRVNLPVAVHDELVALASAATLGTGTFVRSLILAHLAKVHAAEKARP